MNKKKPQTRHERILEILKEGNPKNYKPTKITVTLSRKAAMYFDEIMYSMTKPDGYSPASQSETISEILEELFDFENLTDDQLPNWLDTNFPKRDKSRAGSWSEKYPEGWEKYPNKKTK